MSDPKRESCAEVRAFRDLGVRQRLACILAAMHASVEELETELAPGVC